PHPCTALLPYTTLFRSAAKKADRIAAEGLAAIKIDGNTAAIVEVNSETDFVAKNPEFQELVDAILDVVVKNDVKTVEEALACDGDRKSTRLNSSHVSIS